MQRASERDRTRDSEDTRHHIRTCDALRRRDPREASANAWEVLRVNLHIALDDIQGRDRSMGQTAGQNSPDDTGLVVLLRCHKEGGA